MRVFNYIVKSNKLRDRAGFMRRAYKLTSWLSKRYNIEDSKAELTYTVADKTNHLILITIIFEEDEYNN